MSVDQVSGDVPGTTDLTTGDAAGCAHETKVPTFRAPVGPARPFTQELDVLAELLGEIEQKAMRMADIAALLIAERNEARNERDELAAKCQRLERELSFTRKAVLA